MPHFDRRKIKPREVKADYRLYRPWVREDFRQSCAYCLLEEILAGGAENFELDHFQPQSLFPELAHVYANIYYACHPCNHIKSNRWPTDGLQAQGIGYVDLCRDNFAQHFAEDRHGRWKGLTLSGAYTIDSLRLNRPHLVEIRQLLQLIRR